jgi:hypothetical protein
LFSALGKMELEIDKNYEVEHSENFVLTAEQTRKLIWQKFARNNMLDQLEERERQVQKLVD